MLSPRPEHNRPMDPGELLAAVRALMEIDHAGQLDAMKDELTAARAWPISLDAELRQCSPGVAVYVPMLAGMAQKILGAPYRACLEAATAAFLETRRQKALEIIRAYQQDLRGQHGR
jgi:hypothetical protein